MRVDILCVTFSRDVPFLRAMLASVEKFATGFGATHLVVPSHEHELFASWLPSWVILHSYPEIAGKGMIQHEAEILRADFWCPLADAILHLDSDCIFTQPVTPLDYLHEGRPIIYREHFETFPLAHPIRYGWKKTVRAATGIDPVWETMVRHPAIHLRTLYPAVRILIESYTGMSFYDYILSCQNEFPQTFAEFPTMGAVAIVHFPQFYRFVDFDGGGKDYPYRVATDRMISFWSHGGLDAVCDRDMEYPGGNTLGKTPRQVFADLGLCVTNSSSPATEKISSG